MPINPIPRADRVIAEFGMSAARCAEAFMDLGRALEEADRDARAARLKRRALKRARRRRWP